MEKKLFIRIKNDQLELQKVQALLEEFYNLHNLPDKVISAIDMAAEELLTNIISYGYDSNTTHYIEIWLTTSGKEVSLVIEDDGKPFNPLEAPEPDTESDIEDRPIGGLGLFLVKKMMDEVKYEFKSGRNSLKMIKKIT